MLAVNVLRAVRLPGGAEVIRIFVIAGSNTHQNAAIANAFVVLFHALFRYVPADQRADNTARGGTGTGTGIGAVSRQRLCIPARQDAV